MLALVAALCVLALPAAAGASPSGVIQDCNDDGDLDRKYSKGDLRKAQEQLPGDVDEYSDCREVIAAAAETAAVARKSGGGGSSSGSGGASAGASSAKAERAALAGDQAAADALARSGKKPSVTIAGKEVEPGDNGLFNLASATNGLPTPLLLALLAALVLAVCGGLVALRRRVPALERVPVLGKLNVKLPRVPLPPFRR